MTIYSYKMIRSSALIEPKNTLLRQSATIEVVMANKKPHQLKKINNRRARFDYELGDSLVVGIELTGPETKALRMGHGQLKEEPT